MPRPPSIIQTRASNAICANIDFALFLSESSDVLPHFIVMLDKNRKIPYNPTGVMSKCAYSESLYASLQRREGLIFVQYHELKNDEMVHVKSCVIENETVNNFKTLSYVKDLYILDRYGNCFYCIETGEIITFQDIIFEHKANHPFFFGARRGQMGILVLKKDKSLEFVLVGKIFDFTTKNYDVLDRNNTTRCFESLGGSLFIKVDEGGVHVERVDVRSPVAKNFFGRLHRVTFISGGQRYFTNWNNCIFRDDEGIIAVDVSSIFAKNVLNIDGEMYMYHDGAFYPFSIMDVPDTMFSIINDVKCELSLDPRPCLAFYSSAHVLYYDFLLRIPKMYLFTCNVNVFETKDLVWVSVDVEGEIAHAYCNENNLVVYFGKKEVFSYHYEEFACSVCANSIHCAYIDDSGVKLNGNVYHECGFIDGIYQSPMSLSMRRNVLWIGGSHYFAVIILNNINDTVDWQYHKFVGMRTTLETNQYCESLALLRIGFGDDSKLNLCVIVDRMVRLIPFEGPNSLFMFVDKDIFVVGDQLYRYEEGSGSVVDIMKLPWKIGDSDNFYGSDQRERLLKVSKRLEEYMVQVEYLTFKDDYSAFEISVKRISVLDALQATEIEIHKNFSNNLLYL
ncbi:hypothetical protein PCE1_001081 [Barthelona sp. PCE]